MQRAGEPAATCCTCKRAAATDAELMLMLEHLWANGDALFSHDGPVFDAACRTVAACLESFLRLAEERNRLLGLGWESEFGWKPSTRLGEGSEN